MKIGDFAFVEYDTGEVFNGEIVNVRAMDADAHHETERVLFTVHSEYGYRSMYLDKCVTFDIVEKNN